MATPRKKKTETGATPAKRKTAAKRKAAPRKQPGATVPASKVTPEERHRRIAEAAYFIALERGFASDPHQNWLAAEKQVDEQIAAEGGK